MHLETFDWRIHRSGGALEFHPGRRGGRLLWRNQGDGIRHRLAVDSAPSFPAELPEGPLRDEIASAASVRRLVPVVTRRARKETIRILDDLGKTVARAELERSEPIHDPRPRVADHVLRVVPMRGYDEAFDRLEAFVVGDLGLPAGAPGPYVRALQTLGRAPGDYTDKPEFELEPDMRADDAARRIHLALLDVMDANVAGIRDDVDTEFLHDFRTAVRRIRAALSQIKGVFPESVVDRHKEEFRWLQRGTGALRDLHVHTLRLPTYEGELPAVVRRRLAPLREYLRAHTVSAHQDVCTLLASPRFERLDATWRGFLESGGPARPEPPEAAKPAIEVATARIARAFRRVVRRGDRICDSSPAAALHDVRIECKKLRYLVTFFESLFPTAATERLVGGLKGLQDHLGDFNDLEVQQAALSRFADDMVKEGYASSEALLAMGRLVERLAVRQSAERDRFEQRFAEFASEENRVLVAELFGGGS